MQIDSTWSRAIDSTLLRMWWWCDRCLIWPLVEIRLLLSCRDPLLPTTTTSPSSSSAVGSIGSMVRRVWGFLQKIEPFLKKLHIGRSRLFHGWQCYVNWDLRALWYLWASFLKVSTWIYGLWAVLGARYKAKSAKIPLQREYKEKNPLS